MFEAGQVAGSATYEQSKTLCCPLRSVCLFSHENKQHKKTINEQLSLLINSTSPQLHSTFNFDKNNTHQRGERPAGSFTQLYWRLCINTHAQFKCKPKWTQVQPNLETPVMSSCKDVWIIIFFSFTKKVPKQQKHLFFKNIPSLTRAQARLCKLVFMCGLIHSPPPPSLPSDISGLAKVLNILSVYY